MKTAIFNNLYFPYNRGGAEEVVRAEIEKRLSQGEELILFTTGPKQDSEKIGRLTIYRFPSRYLKLADLPWLGRLLWQLGQFCSLRAKKIIEAIETEKPNLALTHNLMGLGWNIPRVLARQGIQQEHFLHDIQLLHPSGLVFKGRERILDSLFAKLYQSLTKSCFKKTAKVISPSRWLLDEHLKRGFFKKAETEIRPFEAKGIANENRHQAKRLLFVGQIEKHKGIFLLLDAFREMPDPELRLDIVGDGKLLEKAKQKAEGDKRIVFQGRLNKKAMLDLMQEASLLVLPSLCYENYPTVIKQAQAAGLRVLASDLGGTKESIGQNDRLFSGGDKESLKEALKAMV